MRHVSPPAVNITNNSVVKLPGFSDDTLINLIINMRQALVIACFADSKSTGILPIQELSDIFYTDTNYNIHERHASIVHGNLMVNNLMLRT